MRSLCQNKVKKITSCSNLI